MGALLRLSRMHIREIRIKGFKTYREETVISDLASDGINVFVGLNGAGKSNILEAVQFVTSEKYKNLREHQRRALLHEGAGHQSLVASVEVIFSGRASMGDLEPSGSSTTSIKRILGSKKDEYFLDARRITRTELDTWLEAAGIFRSYAAVEQGRIAAIAALSDSERLDLLREISGVQVFEERRGEALKLFEQCKGKKSRIDQIMLEISNKISSLASEKDSLAEYSRLLSRKAGLEFYILEKELQTLEEVSEKESEIRNQLTGQMSDLARVSETTQERIQKLTGLISRAKTRLSETRAAGESLRGKLADAEEQIIKARAHQESVSDLIPSTETNLEGERSECVASLETLKMELRGHQDKQVKLDERVRKLEAEKRDLISKQGNTSLFRNIKERDDHLKVLLAKWHTQREGLIARLQTIDTEKTKMLEKQQRLQTESTSLALEGRESEGASSIDQLKTELESVLRESSEVSSLVRSKTL